MTIQLKFYLPFQFHRGPRVETPIAFFRRKLLGKKSEPRTEKPEINKNKSSFNLLCKFNGKMKTPENCHKNTSV